ncbi:hypothetical protein ACIG3E_08350 [Streptomyces sp. NPDC053474]|uniref:hypothetical protein n=1 Tax=Streptomyces sp. NPDC053474 TaxID=3365704 RepID=UPI0037D3BC53
MKAEDSASGSTRSSRRAGRPLAFRYEIRVVYGPEGEELARQQAAVVRDVLIWIAEHRREGSAEPDVEHAAAPPPGHDA